MRFPRIPISDRLLILPDSDHHTKTWPFDGLSEGRIGRAKTHQQQEQNSLVGRLPCGASQPALVAKSSLTARTDHRDWL